MFLKKILFCLIFFKSITCFSQHEIPLSADILVENENTIYFTKQGDQSRIWFVPKIEFYFVKDVKFGSTQYYNAGYRFVDYQHPKDFGELNNQWKGINKSYPHFFNVSKECEVSDLGAHFSPNIVNKSLGLSINANLAVPLCEYRIKIDTRFDNKKDMLEKINSEIENGSLVVPYFDFLVKKKSSSIEIKWKEVAFLLQSKYSKKKILKDEAYLLTGYYLGLSPEVIASYSKLSIDEKNRFNDVVFSNVFNLENDKKYTFNLTNRKKYWLNSYTKNIVSILNK